MLYNTIVYYISNYIKLLDFSKNFLNFLKNRAEQKVNKKC